MSTIEFFFDLSSPWTRLAFQNIIPLANESGTEIIWRPFLVGGVFNAVNQSVYAARAETDSPKLRHWLDWLKEWATLAEVPMNFPAPHHPLKAVTAMRFCCALEADQDQLYRFAERAFDAYFSDQRNLDDPACLIAIANECGLDGERIALLAQSDAVKTALRINTQEAIDRGAFGSPMIFVDQTFVYFGNDQLPLVRQRLQTITASKPSRQLDENN